MPTSTTLVTNYSIEHGDMIIDIMYTRSCLHVRPSHTIATHKMPIFLDSKIIGLHFAADSMRLSSFMFLQWTP